jgi:xanthine dehydrogenase YagS FAD-binding subunit
VQALAGGTTLIDLMKLDVMRPNTVVDINPLADQLSGIDLSGGNLRLGALARMSDVAANGDVQRAYPVIADALKLAASPQLRNMATLGGNVLQRTRCTYFRDVSYDSCNKRNPGSGCAALEGFNRTHAVLGTSEQCIATYPGDFAQALIALDATIDIVGKAGKRSIPFFQLHKAPGDTPQIETILAAGDLISGFSVQGQWPRSVYLKARDRQSYEFALASAAIALDVGDGVVRDARVALGGVATVPWRAHEAEALLKGQKFDDGLAQRAAEAAFAGARAQKHNAFKIALGQRVVARALHQAAAMEV